MRHYFRPRPPCPSCKIYVVVPDQGSELNQGCAIWNPSSTAQMIEWPCFSILCNWNIIFSWTNYQRCPSQVCPSQISVNSNVQVNQSTTDPFSFLTFVSCIFSSKSLNKCLTWMWTSPSCFEFIQHLQFIQIWNLFSPRPSLRFFTHWKDWTDPPSISASKPLKVLITSDGTYCSPKVLSRIFCWGGSRS